jgi:hypothetical protein
MVDMVGMTCRFCGYRAGSAWSPLTFARILWHVAWHSLYDPR